MDFDITKYVLDLLKVDEKYEYIIRYAYAILKIIIIIILSKIVIKLGSSIIERFFKKQKTSRFGLNERKADTLCELLKSILRYVIYFIAIMWIFESLGFNITTVIAFTGAAGVAIGFGAQNLVKDIITGFFILFEDQFAVGDYIIIEGMSGIVEVLGLRITKIRDFSGDLYIIPNGSITKVTNKSRGNMRALVEFQIAYEEDIDNAIKVIKRVNEEMKKDFKQIVDGPEVVGVTNLGDFGITIRVIAKTLSMEQWGIEAELRKRIVNALSIEGIEIPYPKRVLVENRKER
ncbi:MAG: mechanosensitive ion channel family protein [Clostridiales bacterium]|jgi:small conductance mechanosensitive channel|nr:mechanosensitive ion channel family protein [Clostridiales bacterium]